MVGVLVSIGVMVAPPTGAGLIPAGTKTATDCYGEFDVQGAAGTNVVTCIDGDPTCDMDGLCQGICMFDVAVCLNQTNIPGCTPAPLKRAVVVVGAPLSITTTTDASPVCGPFSPVTVRLKGKKRPRPGKLRLRMTVVTTATPSRERNKLTLICTPRTDACPTTTTTIASTSTSSTTTTLPPPDANALFTNSRLAAFNSAFPATLTLQH